MQPQNNSSFSVDLFKWLSTPEQFLDFAKQKVGSMEVVGDVILRQRSGSKVTRRCLLEVRKVADGKTPKVVVDIYSLCIQGGKLRQFPVAKNHQIKIAGDTLEVAGCQS